MTCRTCKHACTTGFEDPYGVCRRYPPTAPARTDSHFPLVHLDNFSCGEFARGKQTAHPTPVKGPKDTSKKGPKDTSKKAGRKDRT